jgi:hypothetical protein
MRPRLNKASSLTYARRAAVVAVLASLAVIFVPAGSAKPTPSGTYRVCLVAGNGSNACSATAGGGTYSIISSLGTGLQVTLWNDSNQTLDYANLPVPPAIGTINTGASASALNYSTYASTSTSSTLQLRNLAIAPNGSKTIAFVMNPAASCTDGAWSGLVAQSAASGNFYTFPTPTTTGGLTTLVSGSCTLDFTVQPAAALVNTFITGQAYSAGTAVTVTPHNLPVPLTIGTASVIAAGQVDPGNLAVFSGQGPVGFSPNGSAVFSSLESNGTGGPFTLTAQAAGFADAVSSPFVITQDGESCNGACNSLSSKVGNNPLVLIATSGGFAFVGASPSQVLTDANGQLPSGCQSWTPAGVPGFVEFDGGRDPNNTSTMTITYYVSQAALKAKYGKNVGNQFTPICFGAKPVVNGVAVDCTAATTPWTGEEVTGNPATFTGNPRPSECGPGGYEWGILGSYQMNVPADSPVVASWNGPTQIGGNFRAFNIFEPSGWDGRGTS